MCTGFLDWWAYSTGRPVMCVSTFSNISETTGPIEAKFDMELLWDGGTKVSSNGPSHMTNMSTIPVYGKNLKFFSGKQNANDLESWYAASSTAKFVRRVRYLRSDARLLVCGRWRVRASCLAKHSFVEIWSWKNFYDHSLSSADSRRAVVSYWWKNGH